MTSAIILQVKNNYAFAIRYFACYTIYLLYKQTYLGAYKFVSFKIA